MELSTLIRLSLSSYLPITFISSTHPSPMSALLNCLSTEDPLFKSQGVIPILMEHTFAIIYISLCIQNTQIMLGSEDSLVIVISLYVSSLRLSSPNARAILLLCQSFIVKYVYMYIMKKSLYNHRHVLAWLKTHSFRKYACGLDYPLFSLRKYLHRLLESGFLKLLERSFWGRWTTYSFILVVVFENTLFVYVFIYNRNIF